MLRNCAAFAGLLKTLLVEPSAEPFVGAERTFRSPLARKNSLSLMIGPPMRAPYCSALNVAMGLSMESVVACGTKRLT
jgi:hypothetical protein